MGRGGLRTEGVEEVADEAERAKVREKPLSEERIQRAYRPSVLG
jgi:hypothetical protein